MKTFKSILGILAMALTAASCSDVLSDNQVPDQIAEDGIVHFTATLAPKEFNASTRALVESDDHSTLRSYWVDDEEICLYYWTTAGRQLEKGRVFLDEKGVAHIAADFTHGKPVDGSDVTLYYPYDSYSPSYLEKQDGLLSSKLDVREGTGTIKVEGGNATVDGTVNLEAKCAIVCLDLHEVQEDNNIYATKLAIFFNSGTRTTPYVTVESPSFPGASTLYVALTSCENDQFRFVADENGSYYFALGTATLEAGKYYKTKMVMGAVGDVIGADGRFYADAQMAEESGTKAEAVIAFFAQDLATRGPVVAVALRDNDEKLSWANAISGAETWAANHPMKFGEWLLPEATLLMLLFGDVPEALPDASGAEYVAFPYGGFRDLLTNADEGADVKDDLQKAVYWTSDKVEGDSANRWAYQFTSPGTTGSGFYNFGGASTNYVRYVLVF